MRGKSRKNQKIAVAVISLIVVLAISVFYINYLYNMEPYVNLEIKGKVYISTNCTLSDFLGYPKITLDVNSDTQQGTATYNGTSVAYLLNAARLHEDATNAIIQSADGTTETFTLDYIFENKDTMIFAFIKNNTYLSSLNNGEGPLRLIISNEQDSQKWLKDVVSITVV